MFISYTFSYIYLSLSICGFLKDIFAKEICKKRPTDTNAINDVKVTHPIVVENVISLVKTLAIIDLYFLIFGSKYNVLASLIYIIIGVPVMFLINSIMSMGNISYLHSRHTYDTECGIKTRNPMYVMFCDESVVQRFSWVLYIMTFIFGRNEYIILAYVFVPYSMALIPLLNLDLSLIDKNYDLDLITENENVIKLYSKFSKYENITLFGADKIKNFIFFLRNYLPTTNQSGTQKEKNELGDIETYDTIPEAQTDIESLNPRNNEDVNNIGEPAEPATEENKEQEQTTEQEQTETTTRIEEQNSHEPATEDNEAQEQEQTTEPSLEEEDKKNV